MNPQIQNYLEQNLPFYLDMLRRMVAINSFTANAAGVNALADLTADIFADLEFTAERVPSTNPKYGSHLVLTRRGDSNRVVGLIAHLDTVFPPEEEAANEFRWREAGDRIYGPGTNDCKGGTVVIYMVLDAIRKFAPNAFDQNTWVVLLNSSEETLSADFGELCLRRLGSDALAALVFEAGVRNDNLYQLVTARKGMATYHVSVEGKSTHAGSKHQEGANAIVRMAHTVQQIAALTDYERELTFNVGTISGGTVTNRVPHFAEAGGEMRAFSTDVYDQGIASLLALRSQPAITSAEGDFACKVDIQIRRENGPWPRNPKTNRLLDIWQAAAAPLGMTVISEERGGLSDGNHLWEHIPTIDGLGPDGGNSHCSEQSPGEGKEQEYVTVSSFVPKSVLNVAAILGLAADG
ncbi:MAG: M20/M25/M40 family metallo-hydrolase [Chloroflexi bacterium]|nr:M20/M25/M40 family metallo-hydrolase [Chloroflexota bacterium]